MKKINKTFTFFNRIAKTADDEFSNHLSDFSSISEATCTFDRITTFEEGYILQ